MKMFIKHWACVKFWTHFRVPFGRDFTTFDTSQKR